MMISWRRKWCEPLLFSHLWELTNQLFVNYSNLKSHVFEQMQCYSICQSKNRYYYCYKFSPKHSALFVMIPQIMWLLDERCAGQLNSQNWVTSIRAESSREQNMHCSCIATACPVYLQKMKKIQSVFIVQTLERLWCCFFQHVLKHSEKYQWQHRIFSDTTDLKISRNRRSAFPLSHQDPAAFMSVIMALLCCRNTFYEISSNTWGYRCWIFCTVFVVLF